MGWPMSSLRSLTIARSDGLNRCDGCSALIARGDPYLHVETVNGARWGASLCSSCLAWSLHAVELAWVDAAESQGRESRKPSIPY